MSQAPRIAVLNAGSATLKIAVFQLGPDGVGEQHRAEYAWPEADDSGAVLHNALAAVGPAPDAIGHRVVHGGAEFRHPARVDPAVEAAIERLIPLAPLHNARALAGIRAARRAFPDAPAFALFDTAFHADRAPESMSYALPAPLVREFGLRRYGFHGIAHAALSHALAEAQQVESSSVTAVTLQLGAGCSACAIADGRSIETSMGYTPLEGLVMTSRSGDIDPSIVLQMARGGYGIDEIERQLNHHSGLAALSGRSDMRDILAAEAQGDERARIALRVFVRRIVQTVGAYLTLLRGEGALVFGGGIGTHSPDIRRRVAGGLAAWGIDLDPALNAEPDNGRISRDESRPVFVFTTDEESFIAREVAQRL